MFSGMDALASNSLLIHADTGTYNKRYYDRNYVDNNEVTFGVAQSSFGFEYIHKNDERITTGGGFAYTNIDEGKTWNRDRYETQPLTLIMVPYLFTGYGFDNLGIEMGISCCLQYSRHGAIFYYRPDGSVFQEEGGGIRLDRNHSHMFINGMIRLFDENSLHCKIRVGRENFDPVDSLVSFALVYPAGMYRIEYYLSLLTIDNYLYMVFNQDRVLKTNQTTGLSYSYNLGIISLGFRGGILIYNAHGGNGSIPFFSRFNCGVFSMFRW